METKHTEPVKHTENTIASALSDKYANNCRYKVANVFVFDWETDFFVQKRNGYIYDFEIKISRSDFFADAKKKMRADVLSTGEYYGKKRDRPNRFYYAVPDGLIGANDVPAWAGLVYITEFGVKAVKNAPLLHPDVIDVSKRLCDKFYYRWIDAKNEVSYLKRELELARMTAPE